MSRSTKPELSDVFDVSHERVLAGIRTATPATVVSFTRSPVRECSVQPDMLAVLRSGDTMQVKIVDRVPIVWPAGGGFAIDADLEVGEQVLLVVSDRDIASWLPAGGETRPVVGGLHSITNAIAIPGLRSHNRQGKQAPARGELWIGADTGSAPYLTLGTVPLASATVEANTISLGEAAALGAARVTDPVAASAAMIAWMTAIGAFCSSISGLPDNTPLVATVPFKALAAAVPSAQATAQALTANILSGSTKTRIE